MTDLSVAAVCNKRRQKCCSKNQSRWDVDDPTTLVIKISHLRKPELGRWIQWIMINPPELHHNQNTAEIHRKKVLERVKRREYTSKNNIPRSQSTNTALMLSAHVKQTECKLGIALQLSSIEQFLNRQRQMSK